MKNKTIKKLLEGKHWTLQFMYGFHLRYWSFGFFQINKIMRHNEKDHDVHMLYLCFGPIELKRCNIPK